MQSSATVGRTDTMEHRPCIAAWHKKVWGLCTYGPPTASK